MRIALLSESKEFGGAEQYLLLLAGGLAALGHQVLFLIHRGASWSSRAREAAWGVEECPSRLQSWLPLRLVWLSAALKRTSPDILHINLPSTYAASFSAGALVGERYGCPVVTTEHLSMIGRSRRRLFLKGLFTRYVRRIIAVSESTRRCLEESHGVPADRITVVLNGIDLDGLRFLSQDDARSRLGIDRGRLAIGCVGELIPRKGHSYLVEAMAEIEGRSPGLAQLVIVGEGRERSRLERQIAGLGLDGVVKLPGMIEGAGSLLKAFDLFVMPSMMEAMPFALIESMAAGLPAVATSVWGIPEIVRDGKTGLLVPPAATPELAGAILKLLKDEDLRSRFGATAEADAREKFSLAEMADKTAAVYEELVAAKSQS